MWITLVFAVFFLIGALANTFGPKPNLIEATAGYAIALCLFEVTRLFRRHERQTAEFCEWLVDHRETIEAGSAEYRGRLIGVDTELTQYHMALSFGVVSVKAPSRLYVVAEEPTFIPALFFTVSSLLLGWWGLPHGPIYTIGAVFSNLHGGKRRRAGDLIVELTAPEGEQARSRDVVKLTERAAQNVYRILAERGFPDGTAV